MSNNNQTTTTQNSHSESLGGDNQELKEAYKILKDAQEEEEKAQNFDIIDNPDDDGGDGGEPGFNQAEFNKFIQWQKQERAGVSPDDTEKIFDTDALLEQLLLWSDKTRGAKAAQANMAERKREAKSKAGAKLFRNLLGFFYQPGLPLSFPWQTTMAKLWTERANELKNAELSTTILESYFELARQSGDKFNTQVILFTLAMGSNVNQQHFDKYWDSYGKKRTVADPDNPEKMISLKMPANKEDFAFETRLRRIAKSMGGSFDLKDTTRFEMIVDKVTGKISISVRNETKIAKASELTTVEYETSRSPQTVAPEVFIFNTYLKDEDARAANTRLAIKKDDILPVKIKQVANQLRALQTLLKYRSDLSDGIREEIEKTQRKRQTLIEQLETIKQVLDAGGYKKGDLKTMLLDPYSIEEFKIGGVKYKEGDLCASGGLIKYMVTKTTRGVNFLFDDTISNVTDREAFEQMAGARRSLEFAWISKHPIWGVRHLTTEAYDPNRSAFLNIQKALSRENMRPERRNFAIATRGFYVDRVRQFNDQYWMVAPYKNKMVALKQWTSEMERNMESCGFPFVDIPLGKRKEELERMKVGGTPIIKEEGIKRQSLGELADILVLEDTDENKETEKNDLVGRAIGKILWSRDVDANEITGKNEGVFQTELFSFFQAFVSELLRENRVNGAVADVVSNAVKAKILAFKNSDKYTELQQTLIDGDKIDEDFVFPKIDYDELLQESVSNVIKEHIKEARLIIEKTILIEVDKKIKEGCISFALRHELEGRMVKKAQALDDWQGSEWSVDFAQLSPGEIDRQLGRITLMNSSMRRITNNITRTRGLEHEKILSDPLDDLFVNELGDFARISWGKLTRQEAINEIMVIQLVLQARAKKLERVKKGYISSKKPDAPSSK